MTTHVKTLTDALVDSEFNTRLEKECEKMTSENAFLCEKLKNQKNRMSSKTNSNTYTMTMSKTNSQTKTKTKSRVEAVFYNSQNITSGNVAKNDLFNLAMPINTCKSEDCEFCCLSTNRCGSKKQCNNSKYYIKYVHGFFISICLILLTALIIKCFQIDSYPDQLNTEKINNDDLNHLINMFSIIRNNRKKL
jgi:hypothetical protein